MSERHRPADGAWPNDEELSDLIAFTGSVRHAWALVHGLSRRLQHERNHPRKVRFAEFMQSEKPDDWSAKIQNLEETIVGQRKTLAQLEDCRRFERETEQGLVDYLELLSEDTNPTDRQRSIVVTALSWYDKRLGPRPAEQVER